jgi:hypothetical protein
VKALHSRYNPQAEAERYLAALSLHPDTRCFILIEPGLGYMIPVLARRFPRARIAALHVEASEAGREFPAAHWDPNLAPDAEDFLERELEEALPGGLGAESVRIIEWRPGRDRYGEDYLKLAAAAAAAVRRFDAGRRTVRAFGRRWFRNFFRNLRILGGFPLYRDLPVPVLVTGAGPSLEESLPLIKKLKDREDCFIIASSSSLMALCYGNIVPDLVLSTDGGPWAQFHLYELFRRGVAAALAAAFIAGIPSQCGELPVLWIGDGSLWQRLILGGLGIPHLVLPQRGTVAATALDLAFTLGRENVYIAGLDLDSRDIRTHARPYGFDRLWREGASRFRPAYGQYFSRSFAMKEGGSHRVYAEWFAAHLDSYSARLKTLGNNHPLFGGLPPATEEGRRESPGTGGKKGGGGMPPARLIPIRIENPVSRALEILKAGLEDPKTSRALRGELGSLLLPAGESPEPGELWRVLESLAGAPVPRGAVHD